MKNAYIFIIIIALLVALGVGLTVKTLVKKPVPPPTFEGVATTTEPVVTTLTGRELIGVNFIVPGGNTVVRLADGLVDYQTADGLSDGVVIFITDQVVFGEVAGTPVAVAPVAASTGGTGTFLYLVLYEESAGGWQQRGEVLLGDRVVLQSLTIDRSGANPRLQARILDRGEGESLAVEPSVAIVKEFEIIDGALRELSATRESGDE